MIPSVLQRFRASLLASLLAVAVLLPVRVYSQAPPTGGVVPELPVPPAVDNAAGDGLVPVNEEDVTAEVLTRGPVHEAFIEQYLADPTETIVVNKEPPLPIEELPPEDMPEGNHVEWIPGYWAWDEDLDDYIWISGLWRDLPPGQRWIPGYWTELNGGWQWVSGFWTAGETDEMAYLPEPPESLDQGPNIAAPSEEHFWVPGNWVYRTNNYAWQPGYWAAPYNDFMWMPSRYVWTPRGFIFVSGYWDYPMYRRGVLFSPVFFANRFRPRHFWGYRWRPSLVVGTGPLMVHLFMRPRYRHYYFGDFYAPRYRGLGIYPFVQMNTFGRRGYFYDPMRTYYQSPRRLTTFNRLVDWNRYYDRNENLRPPRTFAQTQQFMNRGGQGINQVVMRQSTLGERLTDLSREGRPDRVNFQRISDEQRTQISNRSSQAVRELTSMRTEFESRSRGPNGDRTLTDRTGPRGPDGRPGNGAGRPEAAPGVERSTRDNLRENLTGERGDRGGRPGVEGNRGAGRPTFRLPESTALADRLNGRTREGQDSGITRDSDGRRPGIGSGRPDGAPERGTGAIADSARDRSEPRFGRAQQDQLRERIEATRRGPGSPTTTGRDTPTTRPGTTGERPSTRPSPGDQATPGTRPTPTTRPDIGTRPGTGTRPEPGARPGTGTRPEPGARPGTGTRPEPGARPGTGTRPEPGARPGTGTRPEPGAAPGRQAPSPTPATPRTRPDAPSASGATTPRGQSPGAIPRPQSTPTPSVPRAAPGASTRGTPNIDRSAPTPQRAAPTPQRSTPSIQRSAPAPQRSAPSIQRSAPTPQRSAPSIQRSAPAPQRSAPSIQRSAPSRPSASPSRSSGGASRPSASPSRSSGGSPARGSSSNRGGRNR